MQEVYEFLKGCGVYCLKNAVAQICSFTEEPRCIEF